MNEEIYLLPMTAQMYHEYFKEYQNDLDLYIDKGTYTAYSYDEEKVNQYIQRQIDLNRKVFAIMSGMKWLVSLLSRILKNINVPPWVLL